MLAAPELLPVDLAWQALMAEQPEVAHDHSPGGSGAPLPVEREL